ncbi:MAG: hypothetical protein FWC89_01985 [Defluviitaleaceae bacterium]|nr:hypothetical protein [Defluviitaleaceae bacterium]
MSAGYDTVAKSPALADAFVKEKIHPYCVYSGGGADVLTVAHFSCGKMLLSQAVHVPADFTGQRTAFFAHNYILQGATAGNALSDISKLLNTRFETTYDINNGGELQDIANLESQTETEENAIEAEISEAILTQIVENLQTCTTSAKRTYILVEKQTNVRGILAKIYEQLPEEIKHLLGFCTYSREPEKRKGIHLVFLEKAAYKATAPRFTGDFVIDATAHESTQCKTPKNGVKGASPLAGFGTASQGLSLANKIATLPYERFFTESDFWHTRMPLHSAEILKAEIRWLDKNIDTLSLPQFAAIPNASLARVRGDSIHLILSILQNSCKILITDKPVRLRYTIGSYPLSNADYSRVIKNLRRLYQEHIKPPHYEDLEFLFRARGTGQLNSDEFLKFVAEFDLDNHDVFMLWYNKRLSKS